MGYLLNFMVHPWGGMGGSDMKGDEPWSRVLRDGCGHRTGRVTNGGTWEWRWGIGWGFRFVILVSWERDWIRHGCASWKVILGKLWANSENRSRHHVTLDWEDTDAFVQEFPRSDPSYFPRAMVGYGMMLSGSWHLLDRNCPMKRSGYPTQRTGSLCPSRTYVLYGSEALISRSKPETKK